MVVKQGRPSRAAKLAATAEICKTTGLDDDSDASGADEIVWRDHSEDKLEVSSTEEVTRNKKPPENVGKFEADAADDPPTIIKGDIGKAKDTTKQEEKEEDTIEPPKKKKKRGPRVSEEVIKAAATQILAVLIQNYKDGMQEIPLDILAGSIKDKRGKPYTNHRSDAIAEGMRRLKNDGHAERIPHGKTGAAKLTDAEIAKIPKEVISKDPSKVLEQRRAQFLERLAKHKKGGTGETVVSAANAVWNKLQDGKAYSRKELVAVTSYKGTNSSGFEGIMKVLSETGMIEGKGKSQFTDKVFPHGRPE